MKCLITGKVEGVFVAIFMLMALPALLKGQRSTPTIPPNTDAAVQAYGTPKEEAMVALRPEDILYVGRPHGIAPDRDCGQ